MTVQCRGDRTVTPLLLVPTQNDRTCTAPPWSSQVHTRYSSTAEALGRTHLAVPRYQLSPHATHLTTAIPSTDLARTSGTQLSRHWLTLSFIFHALKEADDHFITTVMSLSYSTFDEPPHNNCPGVSKRKKIPKPHRSIKISGCLTKVLLLSHWILQNIYEQAQQQVCNIFLS